MLSTFTALLAQTAPETAATAAEASEQAAQSTGIFGFSSTTELLQFFVQTWFEGGWLMIPLCLLAFLIYFEAMALIMRFAKAKLKQTPRSDWEGWLDNPEQGRGHVGEVIEFVAGDNPASEEALLRLEAVKARLIPDVNSRITVLSILVTIAPLMGLLGTVIGMLQTFRGLASASGQAVELVAEGIRVALITTQTGLMIAIPGYIFISLVVRRRNAYLSFLTEIESCIVQRVHNKGRASA